MTKSIKWQILRALPPLDDETWYKIITLLGDIYET